jgi:hypothetical protein
MMDHATAEERKRSRRVIPRRSLLGLVRARSSAGADSGFPWAQHDSRTLVASASAGFGICGQVLQQLMAPLGTATVRVFDLLDESGDFGVVSLLGVFEELLV